MDGAFQLITNFADMTGGTLSELNALVSDATLLADTVGTADIDNQAVTTAKLSTTGVVAGSYTNCDLTIGVDGRITAVADGAGSGASSPTTLTSNAIDETPLTLVAAVGQTAPLFEYAWTNFELHIMPDGHIKYTRLSDGLTSEIYTQGGDINIKAGSTVWRFSNNGRVACPGSIVMGGSIEVLKRSGNDLRICNNSGQVILGITGADAVQTNNSTTAGETRLDVWDVDTGAWARVIRSSDTDIDGKPFLVLDV